MTTKARKASIRLTKTCTGRYEYKGYTVQRIERSAEEAKEMGLPAGVEWYITFPGRLNADEVCDTLREAKEMIQADIER